MVKFMKLHKRQEFVHIFSITVQKLETILADESDNLIWVFYHVQQFSSSQFVL
jgi:hypothetical protein